MFSSSSSFFSSLSSKTISSKTKQTPVEKLLSQADEIIASQKTDPIVFSAMAENLALTWKNLTIHLQQRQKTLAQSVTFYRRCEEVC